MAFAHITGPRECHGVKTPEEYERAQADYLRKLTASGRVAPVAPFEAPMGAVPYVSLGRWVLDCPCGNAPSVSPEWDLACCYECGGIYRGLAFPDDRESVEAELLTKARGQRTWHPDTGIFVDPKDVEIADLREQIKRIDELPVEIAEEVKRVMSGDVLVERVVR